MRKKHVQNVLPGLALLSVILFIAATSVYLWQTLSASVVINDAGLYAELTRLLLAPDAALYVDLWDNKPPLLFVYTAPFVLWLGPTTLAIQLAATVEALLFAVTTALVAHHIGGTRWLPTAITGLLALFFGAVIVLTRSIETTVLMAICINLSLYAAISARGRPLWLLASGSFIVLAAFAKQPGALALPAIVAATWLMHPARHWRAILWLIAGCCLASVAILGWSLLAGNLPQLVEYVGLSNIRYAVGDAQAPRDLFYVYRETLPMMTPLLILALPALWQLWRDQQRGLVALFMLWIVVSFVGASLGRSLKISYFVQLMPPLMILIGLGCRYLRPRAVLFGLILVPPIVIISAQGYIRGFDTFLARANDADSPTFAIADYIQQTTTPDDCLWIWGYVNNISYYAQRPSCTAVPYEAMVMNSVAFDTQRYRPQYMQDLFDQPPAYQIEASAWGYFPMLEQYARRYLRQTVPGLPNVRHVDMSSWRPADQRFGDLFTLMGVDVFHEPTVCTGDTLRYALTWRVDQPPGQYYQMFVQFRDSDDHTTYVSRDMPPLADYPTQAWTQPGEIVLSDIITIPLTTTPPGTYYVAHGFYDTETLERLPITGADGGDAGTEITLARFGVQDCE